MKKLLYVVMAALVLVACNPNEPKVVNKDKKMLDKGTKELLSLLGQKEKTVINFSSYIMSITGFHCACFYCLCK